MQLIRHLNDDDLTDILLESDERDLLPFTGPLPESLRSAAGRPEWFWQKQHAAIRGRIAERQSWLRPAISWATVMALFVLAALLLRGHPQPPVERTHVDSDQELMLAVEHAVQSDVPSALEPAAILADEIGGWPASHPRNHQKEKRNAE